MTSGRYKFTTILHNKALIPTTLSSGLFQLLEILRIDYETNTSKGNFVTNNIADKKFTNKLDMGSKWQISGMNDREVEHLLVVKHFKYYDKIFTKSFYVEPHLYTLKVREQPKYSNFKLFNMHKSRTKLLTQDLVCRFTYKQNNATMNNNSCSINTMNITTATSTTSTTATRKPTNASHTNCSKNTVNITASPSTTSITGTKMSPLTTPTAPKTTLTSPPRPPVPRQQLQENQQMSPLTTLTPPTIQYHERHHLDLHYPTTKSTSAASNNTNSSRNTMNDCNNTTKCLHRTSHRLQKHHERHHHTTQQQNQQVPPPTTPTAPETP